MVGKALIVSKRRYSFPMRSLLFLAFIICLLPCSTMAKNLVAVGHQETHTAAYEDTLIDLAPIHDLGYVELLAANPGVDPWLPGKGTEIILPKQHLLPDAPHKGILINLGDMRMYRFDNAGKFLGTHPLGIGREGLNTPRGETKIIRKTEGPTWRPTARMREEDPDLPAVVPPGPDNPLGSHALYLDWPTYLIHGTSKPNGVGRRVSSGCIRMYPDDIKTVFQASPIGTNVHVIHQAVKLQWMDGMLYVEAHPEDVQADELEYDGKIKTYILPEGFLDRLQKKSGAAFDRINWETVQTVLRERRGIPVSVLDIEGNGEIITTKQCQDNDETPFITDKLETLLTPSRRPGYGLNQ